jgi:hypothetical protein
MKSYFIDTAATVTFFTVVAALSELLIAGMDPKQVLIARLIMIPVMMATARPYGLWRDWFFSKTRPQRRITNVVCDIIAFITFQVPVYVVTLALAGATASEIAAAVSASQHPAKRSRPDQHERPRPAFRSINQRRSAAFAFLPFVHAAAFLSAKTSVCGTNPSFAAGQDLDVEWTTGKRARRSVLRRRSALSNIKAETHFSGIISE